MQKASRKNYLGATDIVSILGLNTSRGEYEVWLEKTGRFIDDVDSEAMKVGRALETCVLDWAEEQLGCALYRNVELNHESGIIIVHPDGLTVDGDVVEAKTSGILSKGAIQQWGEAYTDEVPAAYYTQAVIQAVVAGAHKAWIAALLGGLGYRMYVIDVDDDLRQLGNQVLQYAVEWWGKYVVNDEPPPKEPPIWWLELAARVEGKKVKVSGELVNRYLELNKSIAALEKEKEEVRKRLLLELSDAEIGESDAGIVTYKRQFRKETIIQAKWIRVFRVKGKKDHKGEDDEGNEQAS